MVADLVVAEHAPLDLDVLTPRRARKLVAIALVARWSPSDTPVAAVVAELVALDLDAVAELHEVAAGAELEGIADRGGGGGDLAERSAVVSGSGCGC